MASNRAAIFASQPANPDLINTAGEVYAALVSASLPSPRPAKFFQERERIVLAIAGIGRKRARLAIGKPKILRLSGIIARASPANLRAARGGIEIDRHLIVAAIMRLA